MLFLNSIFLFWILFIRKCNYKQCIAFKVVAVVEWCRKVLSFSVSSLSFKTATVKELIKETFMKYFLAFIDINLDAQKVFQMIPKQ